MPRTRSQTTFLYLARNGHKIRQPERLVGWLHRVAQRAAVATLPSKERESTTMVEPPAATDDPLDQLAQKHQVIVLDEELADLPEHYRSAIVMHLYEGESIQSLAEKLGTTPGSVRGRLQRGKQLLATRLRRRGLVPVVAYAAAQSCMVEPASASEATETLLNSVDADSGLPDAPIETSLLESLLVQGIRLMPTLSTFTGLACGTALIAMLLMTDGQGQEAGGQQVTLPSSDSADASAANTVITPPNTDGVTELAPQFGGPAPGAGGAAGPGMGGGMGPGTGGGMAPGMGGGMGPGMGPGMTPGMGGFPGRTYSTRISIPESKTAIAEKARNSLSAEVDLSIGGKLSELPAQIASVTKVPVLLDKRGLEFAKLDQAQTIETTKAGNVPLRSAIRMALQPYGLKIVVEDEGFVITADPSTLVHRGIGTTKWINIDHNAEARIAAALDEQATVEFIETPLTDALELLKNQHAVPLTLDRRALEEIGLSGDEPVTLAASNVTLRSVLVRMLEDLDLSYNVRGESLVITTIEASESKLVTRMYWLEGTGFVPGDYQSIIDLVQTSVTPDTWEALGGPSTMAPVTTSRPGLLISTTYSTHEVIDKFFSALRETHFGVEPIAETVSSPAPQSGGGLNPKTGPATGGGGFF